MEAQLYAALYRLMHSLAHPRRPRVQFGDRIIVMVYLWSVLWDRPVCWACQRCNWPSEPPFQLPSGSTMSKRLRTLGVQQLLERALAAGSDLFGPPPLVKQMDSKPLTVGAYSRDADARRGRAGVGQLARGYRLHTLNHGRVVRSFVLSPMNDHDAAVAPRLIDKLEGTGYALADNAYDSNALYVRASEHNHQLVAPAQPVNKGVRDLRHNSPQRLRSLDMLDSPLEKCGLQGDFGRQLYNCRQRIESGYGGLTFLGLDHLPPWVRGPRRVALWAVGKILIYLTREAKNKGLIT
jgi:hypothetical protein